MPRNTALVFAVAALIAAGAFAYSVLRSPPSVTTGSTGVGTDVPALDGLERRLTRLEAKVFAPQLGGRGPAVQFDGLDRRVRALERGPAAPRGDVQDAPRTAAGSVSEASRPAETRGESPRALSDDALLTQARDLGGTMGSAAAAPYWRELIFRNPTDAVLVEAQFGLGLSLRVMKKHEEEESAFLEVVRVAGLNSPRAQDAMFQVAWSRYFRDDFDGALRAMEEVAASPASRRELTGHARLNVALNALKLNDAPRARDALESMVRDFSGSVEPMHTWFVEQATERLKALDAR